MQSSALTDLTGPSLAALGIRPKDAAHALATILQLSRRPVTLMLRDLAGVNLRPVPARTGNRALNAAEAHLMDAPEGTPCYWRTARLSHVQGRPHSRRSRCRPRRGELYGRVREGPGLIPC